MPDAGEKENCYNSNGISGKYIKVEKTSYSFINNYINKTVENNNSFCVYLINVYVY